MDELRVLSIRIEAITTSFRYPNIMITKLPTFDMPPPATIYGNICCAVGDWFNSEDLEFAYVFTSKAKCFDLETTHVVKKSTGRLKGFSDMPKNTEGSINVYEREFLFMPILDLYIKGKEGLLDKLEKSFIEPAFDFVIGRSQDLASCTEIDFITIKKAESIHLDNTLLPWEYRKYFTSGKAVMMPEYLDYLQKRTPYLERYLQLKNDAVFLSKNNGSLNFINHKKDDIWDRDIWEDRRYCKRYKSASFYRGLVFHKLKGRELWKNIV